MVHGRNFAFSVPEASLVALCDPNEESRKEAASVLGVPTAFSDYRDLLAFPGLDAVVIVTPTRLHCQMVIDAVAAGKHILCEKPMAMTPGECDAMIAAADAARVKLQIGFMRRFAPAFQELKARVVAGQVGEVVSVRSLTHGPSIPQPWMYDLAVSNGPLAEVNSHDIDTVRWITGSDITEVYAIGGNFRSPGARADFPDFYDNVTLIAKFANGMQGAISGAQGVKYGYDSRCEVLGTKGILFAGSLKTTAVTACTEEGISSPAIKSWRDLFADAYLNEDKAFIRCIVEDTPPEITGLDGKRAVQIVNAGNESIRTGLPVKIL
jgi:myo-inositol 2-dehydrogenase/D-chiro-inositol 1-dehydrogenase/scyllo-inositol 2-dehydrogenase (NAD+)